MPQLVFDRLYLLNCHLQTIEFTINLSLQMGAATVHRRFAIRQSLAAVPTQWLIIRDALTEQQSLDLIAMPTRSFTLALALAG